MSELEPTRAKILGKLIQDARVRADRSVEDCAQLIGVTAELLSQIESGESTLSLPELEVLAMALKVPMSYFWEGSTPAKEKETDYAAYVELRQRIIGTLIRQARLDNDLSRDDLAESAGIAEEALEAYEAGTMAIPYFELEKLAGAFDVSLSHFGDGDLGPLARHEREQMILKRFNELPAEVRAFVAEPINKSYLETAMRLSEMDVIRLRGIAESILDITY